MTQLSMQFEVPPDLPAPVAEGNRQLGLRGEQVAAAFLESWGHEILDRNWRGRDGEIDLVARHGEVLVIVEVKTRSGWGFGAPAAAITQKKYARLRRLAAQWLDEHEVRVAEVRIDIVGVILTDPPETATIDHIMGAFR
ncbi:MAG: YraN family protein [Micrococcales bacterium]|nr:YraN family protein [Micrococcales bacterium]